MQEHIEMLKQRAFVSPGEKERDQDENRLKLIREVSAEYLATMERLSAKIERGQMTRKPHVTLPGKVERVIEEAANEPEKAEISIDGADPLYREIRIQNALKDESGQEINLKENDNVDITVETDEASPTHEKNNNDEEDDQASRSARTRKTA